MNYANLIDHTVLKPDVSEEKIVELCQEAIKYDFASVCVNPTHVKLCASLLEGKRPLVCTVIGFPLGASTSEVKAYETVDAIKNGADEIDMVINITALKEKKDDYVQNDIAQVVKSAAGKTVKVIIETCLLTNEEKVRACQLALKAKAHFVKTSTGFSTSGATLEDIILMKQTVGDKMKIKASGGVRSKEDMIKFVEAGANRIGTSSGPKLVNDEVVNSGY